MFHQNSVNYTLQEGRRNEDIGAGLEVKAKNCNFLNLQETMV